MTYPEQASLSGGATVVTITIPTSGAGATIRSLITAGTDTSTGAVPTADVLSRIRNVIIVGTTGSNQFKYGGANSQPVPQPIGQDFDTLSIGGDQQLYVASAATAFTAYARLQLG